MESSSVPMPFSTTSSLLYSFPSSSVLIFLRGTTPTWFYTTAAIVASLLLLEQIVYKYKKRHLPGASWTIPLVGKFADSMSPSMECYKKQWDSGALSAISVFNMSVLFILHSVLTPSFASFIVMASSNEFSRKILNSPTYAEPCLVHSAKQILRADSW